MSSNDDGRLDLRSGLGGHNTITDLFLAVTRLDAKFDTVMKFMTMRDESVNRSIRDVQAEHKEDHADHENRLRMLESRPTITPKAVYTMLGFILALVGTVATVVGLIIKGP